MRPCLFSSRAMNSITALGTHVRRSKSRCLKGIVADFTAPPVEAILFGLRPDSIELAIGTPLQARIVGQATRGAVRVAKLPARRAQRRLWPFSFWDGNRRRAFVARRLSAVSRGFHGLRCLAR